MDRRLLLVFSIIISITVPVVRGTPIEDSSSLYRQYHIADGNIQKWFYVAPKLVSSFDEAKQLCQSDIPGGDLALPVTAGENLMLSSILNEVRSEIHNDGAHEEFFINVQIEEDPAGVYNYKSNGNIVTDLAWCIGEPNLSGTEFCVTMSSGYSNCDAATTWLDYPCTADEAGYACQTTLTNYGEENTGGKMVCELNFCPISEDERTVTNHMRCSALCYNDASCSGYRYNFINGTCILGTNSSRYDTTSTLSDSETCCFKFTDILKELVETQAGGWSDWLRVSSVNNTIGNSTSYENEETSETIYSSYRSTRRSGRRSDRRSDRRSGRR